jgi:hypothetical protein
MLVEKFWDDRNEKFELWKIEALNFITENADPEMQTYLLQVVFLIILFSFVYFHIF